MNLHNPCILVLAGVLAGCARSAAPDPPAPVLAALQCAHRVVARGTWSWFNAGEPVRMASSAADDVARRVHEECSVAAPAA